MARKKKTEVAVTSAGDGTTVAVLPDLSQILPPPSAVLDTTVDASPDADIEIPDGPFVVAIRYDYHSPMEMVGSRGVEVIEFDTDDFNPWFLNTLEEADEAETKMKRAIALLEAGDVTDDSEEAVMELKMTLAAMPAVREDLRDRDEDDWDLTELL